ncbi:MAG: hypothetical protein ACRD01_08735 [Terriglobales bacterium]
MAKVSSQPASMPVTAVADADRWTLIAITLLAGAATTLLHEGLGHGGACLLSGGHNLVISSVAEDCTLNNNWIYAAGTLVNLAAGGLSWWLLRFVRRASGWRYFLWLLMTFNLLTAAGYWLFSGVANLGDWAAILAGHEPTWLWHAAMALGGGAIYVLFVKLAVWELKPFLPCDFSDRVRGARLLMLTPYFTFAALSCIAGVFNPVGAVLILESAAAASLGGASGLAWGWQWARAPHFASRRDGPAPLRRSYAWIVAGAVAAVLFIAVLGPGVR